MSSHFAGAIAAFVLAATGATTGAAHAQAVPPLTDDTKPIRASGMGLNVADLEKSKAFYTEVLGFKVDARVPAQGAAQEYLLGFTGNTQADTLVVLRQAPVQPGATSFGRLVLVVPNGRKMAERIAAAGYPPARIVEGTNIVHDPDGYAIELYQRPAPR
jgi:catechol 2,3-dioxygenase-like lactoylglutathione lyase family enzyme